MRKPKKVKIKINRNVTEVVLATLDRDGCVEEIEEVIEELDYDDVEILSTISVLTIHD